MGSKQKKFIGEILSGHKDNAVEVPFDPATEWGIAPGPLWRGRRGHEVRARINRLAFESAIVPRQRKFYLLIDTESANSAGVTEGMKVRITVEPLD
jgi:Domain of unknown function (DUF1905)